MATLAATLISGLSAFGQAATQGEKKARLMRAFSLALLSAALEPTLLARRLVQLLA